MTISWTETTLGEFCKSKGGKIQTGPFGSSLHQSDYTDEGIPVVMPKDISGMGIDISGIARIAAETFAKLAKHKLEIDEIVFPRRGEITKCALITKEYEGFLCGTGCLKISLPKHAIWPKYFRYFLALPQSTDWLDSNAVGATMKNLSAGILEKFPLRYPPLPIQKKIAGVLSPYDDLIEANLKRIKLLEEMAQITYEEWFVRLRFPGHEASPINSETGLPEGWQERSIDTIGFVNKDTISTKNAPQTIRYIDISSADHGCYSAPQEISFKYAPSRARRIVKFGDTIFSTVRPNRRVYSLVLENDPLLVASTGFAVVTPHQPWNFPFIYLTIDQKSFTEKAVAVAGGAAYPAINQSDFERIKVVVPIEELMKQFSEMIGPNFVLKANLQRQNALLKEARDLLLPRLMTGLIDIDDYLTRHGQAAVAA